MHVMSDSGDDLKDLWEYVGLFRIGDRRRTTRKEQVLRRQRTDRATKVQIRRFLAPYREPYYTPGDKLMVRQLGGRFDEVTGASFPQEVIHRILSFVNEAGARVMHSMRAALPGWMVVIATGGSPWSGYINSYTLANPTITHRVTYAEMRQRFSWSAINARGDREVSSKRIYGPGY